MWDSDWAGIAALIDSRTSNHTHNVIAIGFRVSEAFQHN
jgi:hypothetical protein